MVRILTVAVSAVLIGLIGCADINKPSETPTFELSVTASHGSVALVPSGGTYDFGTVVTLSATPGSGYVFGSWSGDISGAKNPITITMTSDKSVTATFNAVDAGIHGTISVDTNWNNTLNDYYIDDDLTINAKVIWGKKTRVHIADGAVVSISNNGKLTIQEGVMIKLGTGSYLQSGYNTAGTFIAQGSDSLPITFTKTTGVQNWGSSSGGILLYSNTTAKSVIDHCIVEYATTGIYVDDIPVVITNCKIRSNAKLGIDFNGEAAPVDSASFVNDSITDNGSYPISIAPEGLTKLSGDTYMDDNASEGILVSGSSAVTQSGTWKKHNMPYIFDDNADIGSASGTKITVNPGVVCKFNTDKYIQVGYSNSGTLVATGTVEEPITFTKNTGVQNWGYASGGILLYAKTTAKTVFDHCIIEYATTGIYVDNIPVVITNCVIQKNSKLGIDFSGSAAPKDSASFVNDTIISNSGYPISIAPEGLTKLSGDTYMDDNATEGILVSGSSAVTQSGTWKKHNVPYIFDVYADIGSAAGTKITINPGVVCRFNAEMYIQSGYNNTTTLVAIGTEELPITFTKNVDVQNWGYTSGGILLYDKTTALTVFDHCIIDSATTGMWVDAKIAISNSSIRGNEKSGIVFSAEGTPKDSTLFVNNTITGNGEYAIEIFASHLGNLSGTGTMTGNTKGGIYVTGNKVEANSIWKKHDVPYIVEGEVRIEAATGSTVTIQPGARFEFLQEAYLSIGYAQTGALIANGTATDSIVFTAHGAGVPWGYDGSDGAGIMLYEGTAGTTSLTYCLIEKATSGVYVNTKVNVTINKCTISDNEAFGIGYYNEETPIAGISDNTYGAADSNPSGDMINLNP